MLALPLFVTKALSLLEEAGYEAFVVGGAVRDMLRGKDAHDFDITTSATPEEMKEVFKGFRTVETGILHGTLTVLIDDVPLEITTYRIDGGYTDARHPDSVSFTRSLREDAARRDFTVNAMAYHPHLGVKDFFGGEDDLSQGIIRAVGDPSVRFSEDALRILRALRFASALDFKIEDETLRAMKEKKAGLLSVSAERIREELSKLLLGVAVERVLREGRDILATVIPELLPLFDFDQKSSHHAFDLWEHTVRTVGRTSCELSLRLAALLHDVGKPSVASVDKDGEGHFYGHAAKSEEIAEGVLSRLHFDNQTKEKVLLLVKYHDLVPEPHTRQFRRLRSRLGDAFLTDWLALMRADRSSQMPTLSPERDAVLKEAEVAANALLLGEERLTVSALRVGGRELLEKGVKAGPALGAMLSDTLSAVLDGKIPNEKHAILSYLGFSDVECERKFLIRYPDIDMLLKRGATESYIEQTYLDAPCGVTERVRCRTYPDRTVYYHTRKVRLSTLSAEEYEKEISKEVYEELLSRREKNSITVKKRRFALPYESHVLEIDVYPFWSRQAVLEIELQDEGEDFAIPKELCVLREVSDDIAYKNVSLAKKIPPEDI